MRRNTKKDFLDESSMHKVSIDNLRGQKTPELKVIKERT